jgi:hypothetical protein
MIHDGSAPSKSKAAPTLDFAGTEGFATTVRARLPRQRETAISFVMWARSRKGSFKTRR